MTTFRYGDRVHQRAIEALRWAASTTHQAHHHGIVLVNPRPHPTIPAAREADPVNLDGISWRDCPKGYCVSIRHELSEMRREWLEDHPQIAELHRETNIDGLDL